MERMACGHPTCQSSTKPNSFAKICLPKKVAGIITEKLEPIVTLKAKFPPVCQKKFAKLERLEAHEGLRLEYQM